MRLLRSSRPGVTAPQTDGIPRHPGREGFEVADFVNLPSVQAKVQLLAEQVANHVLVSYCPDAPAVWHATVEDQVADAVEAALRSLVVPSPEEWAA